LASWASDARVIEGSMGLRRTDDGSIVDIAEILAALRALDPLPAANGARHGGRRPPSRPRRKAPGRFQARPGSHDDPRPRPGGAAMALPAARSIEGRLP
jgi:hypothetical protein